MSGTKMYTNPRGEGIVAKTGFTPARGDLVELEVGTGKLQAPQDFSDGIIGLTGVSTKGLLQQTGEATIEVTAQYRKAFTAGEIIKGGASVMFKQSDKKVYTWVPVYSDAVATYTMSSNAGGGVHSVVIGGNQVDLSIANGDTPTEVATALAASINADPTMKAIGISASSNAAVCTIFSKRGALHNGTTTTATTSDPTQSITASGATMVGGAGYPEGSKIGRAMSDATLNGTLDVLLTMRGA